MENDTLREFITETENLRARIEPDFTPNPNNYVLHVIANEINNLETRITSLNKLVQANAHLVGRLEATEENLEFLRKIEELLQ